MRIQRGVLSVATAAMWMVSSEAAAAEMLSNGPVSAASQPVTTVVEDVGAPESLVPEPSPFPSSARVVVADPWFTRATVGIVGGASSMQATIPVSVFEHDYTGDSQTAGLAIDLNGRRIGFHLALSGSSTERASSPIPDATGTRLTHGEGVVSLGATILNARGTYLAVGPAVEARATAVGNFDPGNEAVASWQSIIAGGDVRGRVFVGPHVYLTGRAFAGMLPLEGGWQSVDAAQAAGGADEVVGSGRLSEAMVVGGHVAASVRPVEWAAISGGLALRHATYSFEDETGATAAGSERTLRPYLAIELLY